MRNSKELEKKLNIAFQIFFFLISQAIQEQLIVEGREFPNETIRRFGMGTTGKIAGSPRDVIDSKRLYDSFSFKFLANSNQFKGKYSYNADYAAFIYLGYVTAKGVIVPEYRWIEIAIAKLDLESMFAEIWQSI